MKDSVKNAVKNRVNDSESKIKNGVGISPRRFSIPQCRYLLIRLLYGLSP